MRWGRRAAPERPVADHPTDRVAGTSPYRTLLRRPGATALVAAAAPGRLGAAMSGLGLVLLVHAATGSFGKAGVVTGAYAVAAAVTGPVVARAADRRGQSRVLPALVAAHALALAAVVVAADVVAPLAVLAAAGACLGATVPQVGALAAARWSHMLGSRERDRPLLSTAFAMEALGNEASFLVGPALVGTLSATVDPVLGTVTAAVLVVGGGLALALQTRTQPPARSRGVDRESPAVPRVPARRLATAMAEPVLVTVGTSAFFGATQVSVTAFAIEVGEPASAGPLYSVMAVTSVASGLVYGHRHWSWEPRRQLRVVMAAMALTCVPLVLVDGLWAMAGALALTGFMLAPAITLASVLTQRAAPEGSVTQAFTWLGSAGAATFAGSAAVAGQLVDRWGSRAGFTYSLTALVAVVVLLSAGSLARRVSRRAPAR
jgi:MFS family permease